MIYPIYLKLTNMCNLQCKHCYNTIMSKTCQKMSNNMFVSTQKYIKQRIQQLSTNDTILVIFHGGEPMQDGIERMTTLMNSFESYSSVQFTITTNLVYTFSDSIIEFLKRIKTISTSWDYKIRFADSQQQLWENNCQTLLTLGCDVIPIITVTTELLKMQPIKLVSYFADLGIQHINFERLTLTGRAVKNNYLQPTNREIDEWLYQFYRISQSYKLRVSLFESIYEAIHSNQLIGCKARQCQKTVTTINPDGSIAGCPNTADIRLGDVVNGYDRELYQIAQNCETLKTTECYLCKYFKYCNGECFQLQSDETGCPGLKKIMDDMLRKY